MVVHVSYNVGDYDTQDANLLMTSWVVGRLFDNPKCKAYVCMAGSLGYGSFLQSLEKGYPAETILLTNVDVRDITTQQEQTQEEDITHEEVGLLPEDITLFSLCYCPSLGLYKYAQKSLPARCGDVSLISNISVFPDELFQGCSQVLKSVDLSGMSNIEPLSELGWRSLFDSLVSGGTATFNSSILTSTKSTFPASTSATSTIMTFSRQRCQLEYLRLKVESNLASWSSWAMLAQALPAGDCNEGDSSIEVKGKMYNKQQCYMKSIEADSKQAAVWQNIAITMTHEKNITILGKTYSKRDCHVKALENNMKNANVWNDLGAQLPKNGTVVVNSKTYNEKECFISAVNANPKLPTAWCNLASKIPVVESVVVDGKIRTKKECFEIGLGLDPNVRGWAHLGELLKNKEGATMTATVQGKKYTKQQCYETALERLPSNDPDIAPLWANLARLLDPTKAGGEGARLATVGKVRYTFAECQENAIRVDPSIRLKKEKTNEDCVIQ